MVIAKAGTVEGKVAKLGRNDRCWCTSGLKYKNCHLRLDEAKPENALSLEHGAYLKRWQSNSAAFLAQGCYEWMAERLFRSSPRLILDIGCGDGTGLIAMLKQAQDQDVRIISIDENKSCIMAAKSSLEGAGFTVNFIDRVTVDVKKDGSHEFVHKPIGGYSNSQVTLIQSDIISDGHLEVFLSSLGGFDAVTVWLIGTHQERHNCKSISDLGISSNGAYRLAVQNKAYELADRILNQNGILHIVDRAEPLKTEDLRQDVLDSHRDQASETSLEVFEIDYTPYEEPVLQTRVAMKITPGTSGRMPDTPELAMISVLSRK